MSIEYAQKGLIGVFTPQANTTVEPEMAVLTPPGYAWINARMTSGCVTINERLLDYMQQFPAAVRQFANAPFDALAIACTGSSYLIGRDREAAMLAEIQAMTGKPAMTGASASVDALRQLGAKRIGLVSPYKSDLDAESASFWRSCGFDVVAEISAYRESGAFHPIYSLPGAAAEAALREIDGAGLDAVLMLGTGMPTLGPIAHVPYVGRAPVLSCMLCLVWRAVAHCDPAVASSAALIAWVEGRHWKPMLAQRQGA